MNELSPLLSVIITVHNGAGDMGACLRSIALQEAVDDYRVEILVVDDRSTEDIADQVRRSAVPNIRLIRIDEYTSADRTARQVALDTGFERAKGSVIFLIDSDGLAPKRWMRQGLDLLESTGADAVAGPLFFRPPPPFISALQTVDAAFYFSWCRLINGLGVKTGGNFGNFAVRRETYQSTGGFRAIGFALTEDLSFVQALHDQGKQLAFLTNVPVSVKASSSWRAVVERSLRYSTGGLSVLSAAFVAWVLLLPLLAAGSLMWGGIFWGMTLLRFLAGMILILASLKGRIRFLELPALLLYEPTIITIAFCVIGRTFSSREIHWGGVIYTR